MAGRSFDGLARALARRAGRRTALAALPPGAGAGQSSCQGEDEGCGRLVGCCADLVCIRLPLNPTAAPCRSSVAAVTVTISSGRHPPNTSAGPTSTLPPTAMPPVPTSIPEPANTIRPDEVSPLFRLLDACYTFCLP